MKKYHKMCIFIKVQGSVEKSIELRMGIPEYSQEMLM